MAEPLAQALLALSAPTQSAKRVCGPTLWYVPPMYLAPLTLQISLSSAPPSPPLSHACRYLEPLEVAVAVRRLDPKLRDEEVGHRGRLAMLVVGL